MQGSHGCISYDSPPAPPLSFPTAPSIKTCCKNTNKVDRSVTGLVAQQQCVGPLQTPLANCGVVASSHFAATGIATACGEQPMKGLLDPAAMARLTVAESLTNIMWAKVRNNDIERGGWGGLLSGGSAAGLGWVI